MRPNVKSLPCRGRAGGVLLRPDTPCSNSTASAVDAEIALGVDSLGRATLQASLKLATKLDRRRDKLALGPLDALTGSL
eukprot:9486144-Pyramimonas_sp.AAC.1